MIIDGKKLWIEGGYGLNNNYELTINRLRQHAKMMALHSNELELILVDFFIDLRKDPKMYRVKDNICQHCNCGGDNSGTNAIHYLFDQIKQRKTELLKIESENFTLALNQKLEEYIKEDNERYIEEFGPSESVSYTPTIITFILILLSFFGIRYYYGV